jgi:hypothetical protein
LAKYYHLDQIAWNAVSAASAKNKALIGLLKKEVEDEYPMFQKLAAKQLTRWEKE